MSESVNFEQVVSELRDMRSQLEKLNDRPSTEVTASAGVSDQGTASPRRILSTADQRAIRNELRKKSTAEIAAMFGEQLNRSDTGIPVEVWARAGGGYAAHALNSNPELVKAIDSTGASALIRQDLEPMLYELFVREFPAFERFPKEPANGLVHAYNQITSFGSAVFMAELGTVTDDQSTYVRQTTNVAVVATRRGTSLKSTYAVAAGGMSWNPEQLELQGGLRAIAHEVQKAIFQGNSTSTGAAGASTENGAYDANAFDGLRKILNTARAKNVDPTAGTPEILRTAIDRAAEESVEQGGKASIIWLHPHEKVSFDLQQDANVRYMNTWVDVVPGVQTNAVNTILGPLPLAVTPGDSIGTYTATGTYGGNTVRDMYLLDEQTITLPYLGSEGPTVLDIPIGISGQLTHLYILFGMWGLAVKAIPFSNKVRVKQ